MSHKLDKLNDLWEKFTAFWFNGSAILVYLALLWVGSVRFKTYYFGNKYLRLRKSSLPVLYQHLFNILSYCEIRWLDI